MRVVQGGVEEVASCDLCESSLETAVRVPGLESADLCQCSACGLVITNPRPVPSEIGNYYPESYYAHTSPAETWKRRAIGKIKGYRAGYPTTDRGASRAAWRLAAATVGGLFLTGIPYRPGHRRLLDVGCGVGESLRWAKDHGWEVHGVEPDEVAVQHARRRGLGGVREGTLEEQAYPTGYFDAITLYQALEHVYSPTNVLRECHRILADDGEVFISVPNFASVPRRLLGEYWYGLQIPLHLYHFTPATLAAMAARAGFVVSGTRYYSRLVTAVTTVRGVRERARRGRGAGMLGSTLEALRLLKGSERASDIMLFVLRKGG
jgi:2-polyprenyl-3-methyl-5-hydroxy-6-metoxy-1,4-benzoquinol methylase